MIQRIQTLYLLVALLIIESLFFVPLGEVVVKSFDLTVESQNYKLMFNGFFQILGESTELVQQTYALMILIPLIGVLNFIAIFLFKKRTLQLRITMYNTILMFSLSGMAAYILYRAFSDYDAVILPNISMVFPLIAGILNFLAFRQIRKDDALVKSMDRIR